MKKNSAVISGMVLGTLTVFPMTGWSQTSPGTTGSSGSATQQDQQRPKGLESSTGRSSMDSMKHSSASAQWSSSDVKSVQEALKNKGHDPGPIDGVMGARTQQAIRAFQRSQNTQTTGQLDSNTASALGVTLSSASGSSLGGSSSGGASTSSGAPNRDSTVLEKNQGNPRSGGSATGSSTSGSSGSGSSGAGSMGSGT
ncbi:MAG: peptidoglycan-binding domain-containing protein, partial [Candidatus Binatia bacterium]